MTKLQRLTKITDKVAPVVGNVCLFIGAGAVAALMWKPGEPEIGTRVLATTWIGMAVYFAIMANKFRRMVDRAATEEHRDGYMRGVMAMILAYRRWHQKGDTDHLQTVVASANDGLVDWRDEWAVPMRDEFERLDNE